MIIAHFIKPALYRDSKLAEHWRTCKVASERAARTSLHPAFRRRSDDRQDGRPPPNTMSNLHPKSKQTRKPFSHYSLTIHLRLQTASNAHPGTDGRNLWRPSNPVSHPTIVGRYSRRRPRVSTSREYINYCVFPCCGSSGCWQLGSRRELFDPYCAGPCPL